MRRQHLILRLQAFVDARKGFHVPRLALIFLLLAFALPLCAQEFVPERVVFPITDFRPDTKDFSPLSVKFATGFCLDQDCRFVGTNYHVSAVMGRRVRIKGIFSAHRYLDSGPNDAGAQETSLNGLAGGQLKYTPAHDLAIYEMQRPIEGFHGIPFDLDDLENVPEVDIYGYPFTWNPKRGLIHWHGRFIGKTRQGLLAFSYEEGRVRPGASGGIIIDSQTRKVIGILCNLAEGKDHVVLAVPVRELSDFVTRAQPYLQAILFPKTVFVSPVAADLYPPYVWPRTGSLLQRSAEPPEIINLRRTAQHLADSMRNFTATETFAWGLANRNPAMAEEYETRIMDGQQVWRRPGSKKFYDEVPFPLMSAAVLPGAEWSELPRRIGTEFNLKIHQASDAVVGGETVRVFQYAAKAEDRACGFRYVNFALFHRSTTEFVDCHGEVWIDESGAILRISEALDLSGPWYRWRGVMTYGWLERDGTQYPVPVTITVQAEHKRTYWCRGLFMDYKMFGVKAQVLPSTEPEARGSTLRPQ